MNKNPWVVEARVVLLRKLWEDGVSCADIASRIGAGVTKNAVIGKANRLGLPERSTGSRGSRSAKGRARLGNYSRSPIAAAHRAMILDQRALGERRPQTKRGVGLLGVDRPSPIAAEPFVELVIPPGERKTLQRLDEKRDCKWPIGDPQRADFHFCAKARVPGLPYCEYHARAAFAPTGQIRVRYPARNAVYCSKSLKEFDELQTA